MRKKIEFIFSQYEKYIFCQLNLKFPSQNMSETKLVTNSFPLLVYALLSY